MNVKRSFIHPNELFIYYLELERGGIFSLSNTEIYEYRDPDHWRGQTLGMDFWRFSSQILQIQESVLMPEKSKKGKNRNISFFVCSSNVVKTAA